MNYKLAEIKFYHICPTLCELLGNMCCQEKVKYIQGETIHIYNVIQKTANVCVRAGTRVSMSMPS